jgi:hypothetical protein
MPPLKKKGRSICRSPRRPSHQEMRQRRADKLLRKEHRKEFEDRERRGGGDPTQFLGMERDTDRPLFQR